MKIRRPCFEICADDLWLVSGLTAQETGQEILLSNWVVHPVFAMKSGPANLTINAVIRDALGMESRYPLEIEVRKRSLIQDNI